MWVAGLLQPLDHAAIPNFKTLTKNFRMPHLTRRKYSMPYMWGTMGVGYRKSKVSNIDSWSAVWGPGSDQYAGRIAWISEPESMMGMAMEISGAFL